MWRRAYTVEKNPRRGSNLKDKKTPKKCYWCQGLAHTGNQMCFSIAVFSQIQMLLTRFAALADEGWGSVTAVPN